MSSCNRKNWIPSRETDFNDYLVTFAAAFTDPLFSTLGATSADVDLFNTASAIWATQYAANQNKNTRNHVTATNKNTAREKLTTVMESISRTLQAGYIADVLADPAQQIGDQTFLLNMEIPVPRLPGEKKPALDLPVHGPIIYVNSSDSLSMNVSYRNREDSSPDAGHGLVRRNPKPCGCTHIQLEIQRLDTMQSFSVALTVSPTDVEFPDQTWGGKVIAFRGKYVGKKEKGKGGKTKESAYSAWQQMVVPSAVYAYVPGTGAVGIGR